MTTRANELAASGLLGLLALATCAGAWRLGLGDVHDPGPGFMPFTTATLLAAMALGRFAWLLRRAGAGHTTVGFAHSRWRVVAAVLGALVGFGLVIERLGFTLAAFLLLLVLFGGVARKRWWIALGVALSIAIVARVVLRAVGAQLPDGPLGL